MRQGRENVVDGVRVIVGDGFVSENGRHPLQELLRIFGAPEIDTVADEGSNIIGMRDYYVAHEGYCRVILRICDVKGPKVEEKVWRVRLHKSEA